MKRIIIDCDPGIDDSQAIMMAYLHPEIHIEAIMSVAGNVGIEKTTANVLKVLDVLNADPIPVYRGAAGALVESSPDASLFHGEDGLGGVDLPGSKRIIEARPAALGLIEWGKKYPRELSLIAIGPLTNLALALRLDPSLPSRYEKLVVMCGAYHARGNTVNLPAEFNIFADPDAAAVVFMGWPGLTMVSWEVTLANAIPFGEIFSMLEHENPRSKFLKQIMAYSNDILGRTYGSEKFFSADALAMAVMIEPDIIEHVETRYVQIERCGYLSRGMTVVDWTGSSGNAPNTNIVMKVNYGRFMALFQTIFS